MWQVVDMIMNSSRNVESAWVLPVVEGHRLDSMATWNQSPWVWRIVYLIGLLHEGFSIPLTFEELRAAFGRAMGELVSSGLQDLVKPTYAGIKGLAISHADP